ncbi:MAG: hypothetical protein GY944_01795 [bacterium]|nr:hypothetical protein [bacterium]MCP5039730.1 hypothetical protein [bacterium]
MAEISKIDPIVPDPERTNTRRIRRKDEDMPEEERQRLLRKKRAQAKKDALRKQVDDSDPEHDIDIRV